MISIAESVSLGKYTLSDHGFDFFGRLRDYYFTSEVRHRADGVPTPRQINEAFNIIYENHAVTKRQQKSN